MDVIVDGASNYNLKGNPEDVLGAVAAVSEFLRGQGRSILSISVNGEEVSPEALADRLKNTPIASVSRLERSLETSSRQSRSNLSAFASASRASCSRWVAAS